jgi:site-specific DNA-methyltransferase (adenine-specific)
LERSVNAWVAELRGVCRELARVLTSTGSLWLNLGDGYARHPGEGAERKSLLLAPERLAIALTADGWLLRNKVVWAKSNPMPSSVRDRLTSSHEVIYFLTRSARYYFDLDHIRQPLRTTQRQSIRDPTRVYPPPQASPDGRVLNTNQGLSRLKAAGRAGHPRGKNPGDVWTLATANFAGRHFAVFPLALVERPLLATCPPLVCVVCGRPADPPSCGCKAGSRRGRVLDPFLGTGTTALIAERHPATGSASSSTPPTRRSPSSDWLRLGLRPATPMRQQYQARKEVRWKVHHTTHAQSGSGNRPPAPPSVGSNRGPRNEQCAAAQAAGSRTAARR